MDIYDEKDSGTYVINDNKQRAFKLIRNIGGVLQAEVKLKSRDKNMPKYVYVDAQEVVDQVTAAMSQKERLLAYTKLAKKLNKE